MPRVTIHQAKANLSELIEPVERGEEILIAIGKRVVAKIVPVAQAPNQRRLDILRASSRSLPSSSSHSPRTSLRVGARSLSAYDSSDMSPFGTVIPRAAATAPSHRNFISCAWGICCCVSDQTADPPGRIRVNGTLTGRRRPGG